MALALADALARPPDQLRQEAALPADRLRGGRGLRHLTGALDGRRPQECADESKLSEYGEAEDESFHMVLT